MCARFAIISTPDAIRAWFGYGERPNFPPRYNVAPTQPIPVVRIVNFARSFALARWGLIPAWVKDPKNFSLLVNARGESVLDKPAFSNAMRRRRCLIPADGFYEWRNGAPRRPYFVRPRQVGAPLAFAGLWETWIGPDGEEIDTAAIVTIRASGTLASVHDRMPVIIAPEAFDRWLDCAKVPATTAAALIAPAPETLLEFYEVSAAVNRTANDDPRLIEPVGGVQGLDGTAASSPQAGSAATPKRQDQLSLF